MQGASHHTVLEDSTVFLCEFPMYSRKLRDVSLAERARSRENDEQFRCSDLRINRSMNRFVALVAVVSLQFAVPQAATVLAQTDTGSSTIRIATFNCSLNRNADGELIRDLKGGNDRQARKVARILRIVRPAILLLNEFDFDEQGQALKCFITDYLESSADWASEPPVAYPYSFTAAVNTGVPSGHDLDHDGNTSGPADALGFGRFPGQYGMLVLSQFPIKADSVRSFQKLLWRTMSDAVVPAASTPGAMPWYDDNDLSILRISSKSHWDIPVTIHDQVVHLLASHPTPPAFDGPEDRNGRRNYDEIRLWAEYISDGPKDWLVDDAGTVGPLAADASFVILGDQNADPADGNSFPQAIQQLLNHPRVNSTVIPSSSGAVSAAAEQGGMNLQHKGIAAQDTSDFSDSAVGNLRVDYVLPSRDLKTGAAAVYWPAPGEPGADLVDCSDHRLVWIEISVGKAVLER